MTKTEQKIITAIEKSGLNFNYQLRVNGTRITHIINLDTERPLLGKHTNAYETMLDVSGSSKRSVKSILDDIVKKWG